MTTRDPDSSTKAVHAGKGESNRTPKTSSIGKGTSRKGHRQILPDHALYHRDIRIIHKFLKTHEARRKQGKSCEGGRKNGPDLDSEEHARNLDPLCISTRTHLGSPWMPHTGFQGNALPMNIYVHVLYFPHSRRAWLPLLKLLNRNTQP